MAVVLKVLALRDRRKCDAFYGPSTQKKVCLCLNFCVYFPGSDMHTAAILDPPGPCWQSPPSSKQAEDTRYLFHIHPSSLAAGALARGPNIGQ